MSELVRFQTPAGSCNGYLLNGIISTARHCADARFATPNIVYKSDQTFEILASSVRIIQRVAIPYISAHAGITLEMLNLFPAQFHVAGINPETGSSVRKLLLERDKLGKSKPGFIGFPGFSGSPVIYANTTPGRYHDDVRIGSLIGVYVGHAGIFHILGLGHVTNLGGVMSMY